MRHTITRAIFSGSLASLLSGLVVVAYSRKEASTPVQGINDVSHWAWEDKAFHQRKFSWRHTALGYTIHHASSIFWATLFETLLERRLPFLGDRQPADQQSQPVAKQLPASPKKRASFTQRIFSRGHRWLSSTEINQTLTSNNYDRNLVKTLGAAAAVSAVANIVDFRLTPQRFTPGFERHLSRRSLALVYTAFGIGLFAAAQLRTQHQRQTRERIESNRRLHNQYDYDVIHYSAEQRECC